MHHIKKTMRFETEFFTNIKTSGTLFETIMVIYNEGGLMVLQSAKITKIAHNNKIYVTTANTSIMASTNINNTGWIDSLAKKMWPRNGSVLFPVRISI